MKTLSNYTGTCITLGQLREFFNTELSSLPEETPIKIADILVDNHEDLESSVHDLTQVLADEESVEFYCY